MVSLINKQLLLTAYAYLYIMEQQKAQQESDAIQLQVETTQFKTGNGVEPTTVLAPDLKPGVKCTVTGPVTPQGMFFITKDDEAHANPRPTWHKVSHDQIKFVDGAIKVEDIHIAFATPEALKQQLAAKQAELARLGKGDKIKFKEVQSDIMELHEKIRLQDNAGNPDRICIPNTVSPKQEKALERKEVLAQLLEQWRILSPGKGSEAHPKNFPVGVEEQIERVKAAIVWAVCGFDETLASLVASPGETAGKLTEEHVEQAMRDESKRTRIMQLLAALGERDQLRRDYETLTKGIFVGCTGESVADQIRWLKDAIALRPKFDNAWKQKLELEKLKGANPSFAGLIATWAAENVREAVEEIFSDKGKKDAERKLKALETKFKSFFGEKKWRELFGATVVRAQFKALKQEVDTDMKNIKFDADKKKKDVIALQDVFIANLQGLRTNLEGLKSIGARDLEGEIAEAERAAKEKQKREQDFCERLETSVDGVIQALAKGGYVFTAYQDATFLVRLFASFNAEKQTSWLEILNDGEKSEDQIAAELEVRIKANMAKSVEKRVQDEMEEAREARKARGAKGPPYISPEGEFAGMPLRAQQQQK